MIKGSLFLLVFALPLIFDFSTFSAFSLPKLVLVRITTVVLVFVWIAESLAKGSLRVKRSPLSFPLLIFLVVVVVSTFNSVHLRTAVLGEYNVYEGSLTLLSYLLLSFAALNFVEGERDYRLLFSSLLLSASLVSIMGILDYLGVPYWPGLGGFKADGYIRSSATFGNPVILGAYLSLVFPLALVLFTRNVFGKSFRWLAAVSLVTMFPVLLFSGSRGAWAGVGAGLILFLAVAIKDFARRNRGAIISVAAILILLVVSASAVLGLPHLRARALSLGSATDRLMIWSTTMSVIANYPALGTGPDTLGLVFARFKTPAYARSETEKAITSKAHNEFLQVAATIGLLGLAAYLWIIVLTLWKGFNGLLKKSSRDDTFGRPQILITRLQAFFGWAQVPSLQKARDSDFFNTPFNGSGNSFLRKSLLFALLAGLLSYFVQLQFSFSFVAFAPIFWIALGAIFSLGEEKGKAAPVYSVELPPAVRKWWKVISVFLGVAGLLVMGFSLKPWIADRYFTRGEDSKQAGAIDKAVGEYERAVSWNGAEERYRYSLANAYLNKAFSYSDLKGFTLYFNRAINSYRKAQKINPLDEASYYYAGYAYQMGGQRLRYNYFFGEAAKMNRKVLKLNPNSVDGHLNLGTALASVGLVDKAISEWKKAKWLDPKRIDAYYNLGWAYEKEGLTKLAIIEYQNALRINPNERDAIKALKRLQSR